MLPSQYKRRENLPLWRLRSSSSVGPSAIDYAGKTSTCSSQGGKDDASAAEPEPLSLQQAGDVEAMELIDLGTDGPTDSNESEIQPVTQTRSKDSILKAELSVTSSKKEVKFSLPAGGDSASRRGSSGSNAPNQQDEVHRDGAEDKQSEAAQHMDETPKKAEEPAEESVSLLESRRASDSAVEPTVEIRAEPAESGLESVDLPSSVDPPLPGTVSELANVTYMTLPTASVSSVEDTKVITPRSSKDKE